MPFKQMPSVAAKSDLKSYDHKVVVFVIPLANLSSYHPFLPVLIDCGYYVPFNHLRRFCTKPSELRAKHLGLISLGSLTAIHL
eukprot:3420559-Amphidinium_carterae.1